MLLSVVLVGHASAQYGLPWRWHGMHVHLHWVIRQCRWLPRIACFCTTHPCRRPPVPSLVAVRDAGWAASEVGHTSVASLDWSDRSCYADFQPPYDFILAADCVYSELAGEALVGRLALLQ